MSDLFLEAEEWLVADENLAVGNRWQNFYCQYRDVFSARQEAMTEKLFKKGNLKAEEIFLITAIIGEVGNNSFDHNLGKWPNVPGLFFGFKDENSEIKVVLADRGQGVLETLRRVKSELKSDEQALEVAFTEKLSGRAPENRGNGLKFTKESVYKIHAQMEFFSGEAKISLNGKMEIEKTENPVKGCLALITFKAKKDGESEN